MNEKLLIADFLLLRIIKTCSHLQAGTCDSKHTITSLMGAYSSQSLSLSMFPSRKLPEHLTTNGITGGVGDGLNAHSRTSNL
jgi:hypothetical protein